MDDRNAGSVAGVTDEQLARELAEQIPKRIAARIDQRGPEECWPWTGKLTEKGYARICLNGRRTTVHRYLYEVYVGPVPNGLVLDHLCRVRHCVNPAHLEPVSNRENVLRGIGPTAVNAKRVYCLFGHLFDEANTMKARNGGRLCRTCRNRDQRAAFQRRKERLKARKARGET